MCRWQLRDTRLICKTCGNDREEKHFSIKPECKTGYDLSRCKLCKKSAYDWKQTPLNKKIFNRVKARAKRLGREFNLQLDDIVLPTHCPIFGHEFIYGHSDWTYSVDRIDNSKGYVKDNIVIVSNKANRLKNDASIEDLKKIVSYYEYKDGKLITEHNVY